MSKFELLMIGIIAGLLIVPIVFNVEISYRSQVKSLRSDKDIN